LQCHGGCSGGEILATSGIVVARQKAVAWIARVHDSNLRIPKRLVASGKNVIVIDVRGKRPVSVSGENERELSSWLGSSRLQRFVMMAQL
jgi:hypothetical protein